MDYAEGFSAAVDFLGIRPFIDREKIGAIGVCGSGSFVISAAKIDPRMKAIATISMYDMGSASRNALNHSKTVEQRKKNQAEAAEQRYVEFNGGETKYTGGTVHVLDENTTLSSVSFMSSTVHHVVNTLQKEVHRNLQRILHYQAMLSSIIFTRLMI